MTPLPRLELDPLALHGFAGRVVRSLLPTTEADPAALLVTLLAAAGAYVGTGPHILVGDSRHPALVWPLVVGRSGGGRKGTSLACVERLLVAAFPDFVAENMLTGLSSGEGLIHNLRDPEPDVPDEGGSWQQRKRGHLGVTDKRRLIIESEFVTVLARKNREGNTLSALLRDAYDGKALAVLTKGDPMRATGAHVAVLGHITPRELRMSISSTDISNGFLNRFLIVLVDRSKLLAMNSSAPDHVIEELGTELRLRLEQARSLSAKRIGLTDDAAKLWEESLYPELNEESPTDDHLDSLTARGPGQVLRLALTYVLLDGRSEIDAGDLYAAYALWEYACQSAAVVFSAVARDSESQRLRNAVKAAGEAGMSRTEVSKLFNGKKQAEQLNALTKEVADSPDYELRDLSTAGRSARVLVYTGK